MHGFVSTLSGGMARIVSWFYLGPGVCYYVFCSFVAGQDMAEAHEFTTHVFPFLTTFLALLKRPKGAVSLA